MSGSLFGRALGLGCLDIYTAFTGNSIPDSEYWEWLDPGAIALMGAGSLLGGITRLTLAVTVIIVISGDFQGSIYPSPVAISTTDATPIYVQMWFHHCHFF